MITVRNEFETVPAFEHIAGSSFGTGSNRESACQLLKTLQTVSGYDCLKLWQDIAETNDENFDQLIDIQDEIAELLNEYMPMPEFCSVVLDDNEWRVIPSIENADEDCKNFADYQDDYQGDFILVTNDHGNVTCQQWLQGEMVYVTIWDMV